MKPRALVLLLLLAGLGCRTAIPVDTKAAQAIPAALAIDGLRDLLPKASFLGCGEPTISFMKSDVKEWVINNKGVEFRTKKDSYRLDFSRMRGTELTKVPLSYEVRVFVGAPPNVRKDFFRFNWTDEQTTRRAMEYFEALREDR
jgi:hypothetical protein